MKLRIARSFSLILLCVLGVRAHAEPQTTTVVIKNPTIGAVLWWEAKNVMEAGADFAAKKAAFSADIANARAKYFNCYPNCPDIKNAESNFSELLWEKDVWFMYLLYVGGPGPTMDRATGLVDGGLLKNCVDEFGSWEATVEFGSGHYTSIQGPAPIDAKKFVQGLEWAKDYYKKYQTCRDREEFRLHAKPPYNDIPAPPPPKVETDPKKIPVMMTLSPAQLIHLTLLEPVVAPNRTPGVAMTEEKSTVRARLENPLLATGRDVTGTAVMFPAGAELSVTVFLAGDPQKKNSMLSLQVMSAKVAGLNGEQQLISASTIHHYVGWPAAGQVLIPAKTPLSFLLACGCVRSVSKADFQAGAAAVAASANRPAPNYGTRPILMNSQMSITALEAIDVASVGTDKVFRAELKTDMNPPNGMPEVGAIRLPHGTEVYVRAMPRDLDPATYGHVAEVSVDHIVLNGQNIPLVTTTQYISYNVAPANPNARGQATAQRPLLAAGAALSLIVLDQQEVPDSGPAILIGSRATPVAPAVATAPSSPSQPPAQPTPTAPATGPRGAQSPADRQQQINDRQQQTLKIRACRQQAIKDNPKGGAELMQAMRACAQAK